MQLSRIFRVIISVKSALVTPFVYKIYPSSNTVIPFKLTLQSLPQRKLSTNSFRSDFQYFCKEQENKDNVLLDLRSKFLHEKGHVNGSFSIPIKDLVARLFELPAPFGPPIDLFGSAVELEEARNVLEQKGWNIGNEIDSDNVDLTFCDEIGKGLEQIWRPNLFLEFALEKFILPRFVDLEKYQGLAVDIGCGNGRDAVYLAQNLPNWKIVGIDNHKGALKRAFELAERHNCSHQCIWADRDVRRDAKKCIDEFPADIIHGHRFMDKELMRIAKDSLQPGGFFIWSTFMQIGDEENLAPPFRPSRMVQKGELSHIFACDKSKSFTVLCDEEGTLVTRGKLVPANFFIAQKS